MDGRTDRQTDGQTDIFFPSIIFKLSRTSRTQLERIRENLKMCDIFRIIFLDLKKAFDTVPHKRLLEKLKGYGVTGNLLSGISSFITGKTQFVTVWQQFNEVP